MAYSLAYRVLGDRAAAEQIVVESFGSLARDESLPDDESLAGERLISAVHDRAIARVRSSTAADERIDNDTTGNGAVQKIWSEIWKHVRGDLVRQALSQLTPEQRKTLDLAYFSGYTRAEIADLMSVPAATVDSRLRTALQKIKAVLERIDRGTQER